MKVPRLHPMPGSILNALIPVNVKQDFTDIFLGLTKDLDEETFRGLIKANASIWHDILPHNTKQELIIKGDPLGKIISEEMIFEWIIQAKHNLARVFSGPDERLWLLRQINEIKGEICR